MMLDDRMPKQETMITIAKVGAPYRLKGELKLYVLSDSIETALSYGKWFIQRHQSDKWVLLEKEKVTRLGDKLLIQFDGVHTKEDAALFTNSLIGVPREALPQLTEDEFYWSDLIGLDVVNEKGQSFGVVKDIIETGANEVLLCQADKKEYLIPFVEDYVIDVDFNKREVLTRWQYDYV